MTFNLAFPEHAEGPSHQANPRAPKALCPINMILEVSPKHKGAS